MMSYIKLEDAIEVCNKYKTLHKKDNSRLEMAIVNAIYLDIDNLTTADVEEVRHSMWENISGFDVCNICGTSPAYCEPKPNNPKGYPPYCHHCGAKMNKETEFTKLEHSSLCETETFKAGD